MSHHHFLRCTAVDWDAPSIHVFLELLSSSTIDGHEIILLFFGAKTFRQLEHLPVLDLLGHLGALPQQIDSSARFTYNSYSRHLTRVVWVFHELL